MFISNLIKKKIKNYKVHIVIILLFSYTLSLFENLYSLYLRDYEERNLRIYGECKGLSYGFIKKTRINFQGDYSTEPSFAGWDIKIIRITPESHTVFVRNQTTVDSLTEIYRENFCYPNSSSSRPVRTCP